MKKIERENLWLLWGELPEELLKSIDFEQIWNLHPNHFNQIQMYDQKVFLPRWQQPYGHDYVFSQQINKALPIPEELLPFLHWSQELNPRYNGILLNWYDAELKHYIGKHRDSETGLIPNAPILTISLGATRAFRMREIGKKGFLDFEVKHGEVIGIPWDINKKWTHEVPHLEKYDGRRISVTIRAFRTE